MAIRRKKRRRGKERRRRSETETIRIRRSFIIGHIPRGTNDAYVQFEGPRFLALLILSSIETVGEWFPSKSEKRARTVSYRLTKIIIPTDRLRDTIGIEYAWRFYFREEC